MDKITKNLLDSCECLRDIVYDEVGARDFEPYYESELEQAEKAIKAAKGK